MDLLSHLTALSDADLRAVVANRPEAASHAGMARSRLPGLAASLGMGHGIHAAAGRLDRFHHQLLQLACALGGRIDRTTAIEQGVPPDAFEPAALALARLALAFPDAAGLAVPAEVQAAIGYRRSLGVQLRPLLEAETVDELKRMAQAIGAPSGKKAVLVDAIAGRLSDPAFVLALLRRAPAESRHALDVIRESGGEARIHGLAAELGPSVHKFRYGYQRRGATDESGLVWLWIHGLVFRDGWEAGVVVPAPVEIAIRGRAFAAWETAPPEPELVPVAFDRGPLTIVEEMSRLARVLTQAEMPLLKSVEIGVRECRRLAAELGMDEQSVRRLLKMGHHGACSPCAPRRRERGAGGRAGPRRTRTTSWS
jgi:hypothetical protein